MLTISLDRLFDLLDKAADIDIPETVIEEVESEGEPGAEELDEVLADNPAYGVLVEAIDRLTPEETDEILALALLARNEASLDAWQDMVERARAVADETAADEVLRVLLLTDELETALAQLGYLADDEGEENLEEEEEEEGEEEGEEGEEEGEENEGEDEEEAKPSR